MSIHSRNTDPSTSHRAGWHIEATHLATDKQRVEAVIRAAGERGLTWQEAEGPSGVRNCWRRCSDLLQDGLIVDSGHERIGPSGRAQRVYVAPEFGSAVVPIPGQEVLF